jgi:hypothetical protein
VRVRLGRRCRHTSGGGSHQHWSRSGWTVDAVQLSATFSRLSALGSRLSVRGSGLVVVDIAIDVPPGHPPVVSIAGPTFDLEELAGRKLVALFDRAEARDFADLDVARMWHDDRLRRLDPLTRLPKEALSWGFDVERVTGIEPAFSAWESDRNGSVTRTVSRKPWSERPVSPNASIVYQLVPLRCGTDVARRLRAQ